MVDEYMTYREEYIDLFSIPEDYYLAHCISADFGMGKGIVIEFNERFDMKRKLQKTYPDYINQWHHNRMIGDCIQQDRVFNLITKERYWMKPTYESLKAALVKMKDLCSEIHVTKLAMPVIGCGLDRLQWDKVSEIIKDVFNNVDIEILVCKQ